MHHWIAQIAAASRRGLHKDALHLFHQMHHHHHHHHHQPLNPYILPTVLRACAHLSDHRTGRLLHTLITRSLLLPDAFIAAALIDMYSKCGHLNTARKVFDRTPDRDLVVWNSIISGYAHHGLPQPAMVLLNKMQSCGPKPDIVTWNALISGFSKTGNVDSAMEIFSSMRNVGTDPDVLSWTSIISGFVREFRYGEAFGMFRQMVVGSPVLPTSFTVSSVLPACANALDVRRGKEIHGYAVVIGVEGELYVSSSLVDMYAKCGLIFDAAKVFVKMSVRSLVPWNSMMFGLANHGYCEDAIELFSQMQHEGVKPDHLSFTAVLNACSHTAKVDLGRGLFDSMREEYRIEPRLEHYACIVDLLGRAGKLDEAYSFIKEMPVKPDSFVWGAFLAACRNHGNVELAREAASRLFKLEPESKGSHALLSNALASAGRWDEAAKLKKSMKKRKLGNYTGCSWTQNA